MQARAAACKGGGSFALWLETTAKALSGPGEAQSPGRACPRETGDFSISGQTQTTFLSPPLSSQPLGSATEAPPGSPASPCFCGSRVPAGPPHDTDPLSPPRYLPDP